MIDFTDTVGQRALQRIHTEEIIWLTTVTPGGVPQPRPVWFVWDGEAFIIYSKPTAKKVRHIQHNPNVSLHFDAGPTGVDVQVFIGQATLNYTAPPVKQVNAYMQKYGEGILQTGLNAESYSALFTLALRIVPTRLRGLPPITDA